MNKCGKCRFFEKQDGYPGGDCRKRPPTNIIDSQGDVQAYWPYVIADAWCGEFAHPVAHLDALAAAHNTIMFALNTVDKLASFSGSEQHRERAQRAITLCESWLADHPEDADAD